MGFVAAGSTAEGLRPQTAKTIGDGQSIAFEVQEFMPGT